MCPLCLRTKLSWKMLRTCPGSQRVGGSGDCGDRAGCCFPGPAQQAAAFKEELGILITGVGGRSRQSRRSR